MENKGSSGRMDEFQPSDLANFAEVVQITTKKEQDTTEMELCHQLTGLSFLTK